MSKTPTNSNFSQIEKIAIESVKMASKYVSSRFGTNLSIKSKSGNPGQDLVSDVDKKSQEIIKNIVSENFPEHYFLGEEDENIYNPSTDWIWAVDPIDGTNNFVNNSLQYAISVGVLYRGIPVIGVVWVPWANSDSGLIIHSSKDNGCWIGNQKIIINQDNDKPIRGKLSGVPNRLTETYFINKKLRNNLGEERVIGSTAYELFLVAYGSMQFAISGFANVWDFAASIIIIQEAGGEIYYLNKEKNFKKFICWNISHDKTKSIENLRRWKGLILAGNPNIVNFISKNIKKKKKLGIF